MLLTLLESCARDNTFICDVTKYNDICQIISARSVEKGYAIVSVSMCAKNGSKDN